MRNLCETPEEFTAQAHRLLEAACPTKEDTPFFNHCMALARAQGMSWMEGLEYVIQCRRGTHV